MLSNYLIVYYIQPMAVADYIMKQFNGLRAEKLVELQFKLFTKKQI